MERPSVKDDFLDALVAYDWPGNVRQLENFVERLLLTSPSKFLSKYEFDLIMGPFRLEGEVASYPKKELFSNPQQPHTLADDLASHLEQSERTFLEQCLKQCQGHVGKSAVKAGISRRSFTRKMKQHGILRAQFVPQENEKHPER